MPLLATAFAASWKNSWNTRRSRAWLSAGSLKLRRNFCSSIISPSQLQSLSEISYKLRASGIRGEATPWAIIIN